MNNKGFAITTILYGTLILFLMLLLSMLGILSTYNDRLEMLIENNNGARFNINYENIGYWNMNNIPSASERMKYTINDEVVEVMALLDDGYGFIPYYVDLIADETYYFDCDSNGKWMSEVEAFLMLNGKHVDFQTTTVHLTDNKSFEFTPPATGKYWLRLDVNNSGNKKIFSNIKILGKKKVV